MDRRLSTAYLLSEPSLARKVIVLPLLTPVDGLVLFPARTAISHSLELPFRGSAGCDMFVAPIGEVSIGRQAAVIR